VLLSKKKTLKMKINRRHWQTISNERSYRW